MKKISVVVVLILIVGFIGFVRISQPNKEPLNKAAHADEPAYGTQPSSFFEEDVFFAGVSRTQKTGSTTPYTIKAGIYPHHQLPGFMFSDFFQKAAQHPPQTIILIGPNHYEVGDASVLTGKFDWDTPFGKVRPNQDLIDTFVSAKLAKIDDESLTNEHSVGSSMPYLSYYLPTVKVVPLIVSAKITVSEIDSLAAAVINEVKKNPKILVVASVDFSHYLTSEQAEEKDTLTYEIIQERDYEALLKLNNDYVDSPASIAVLLQVAEGIGAKQSELFFNTNSGRLLNQPFASTTSYFSIAFY